MTGRFQKLLEFWMPPQREQHSKVLVAGKFVNMTAAQARRYRELRGQEMGRLIANVPARVTEQ